MRLFIKPFTLLTAPLLESKSCWGRVWLFIEPFTPLTPPIFKAPSITNGEKQESSLIPASNLSSYFSSGSVFCLLPVPDGGLDCVLFYDWWKDIYMDDNFICIVFEVLLLNITHWRGIVNIFEIVVCWLDAHQFLWVWWKKRI